VNNIFNLPVAKENTGMTIKLLDDHNVELLLKQLKAEADVAGWKVSNEYSTFFGWDFVPSRMYDLTPKGSNG